MPYDTRNLRVLVTITRPDPKDQTGEFDVEKEYMVNTGREHTRSWMGRTAYWALSQGFGFLVEPYVGPEDKWVEFWPGPPPSNQRPVGKRRREGHRTQPN